MHTQKALGVAVSSAPARLLFCSLFTAARSKAERYFNLSLRREKKRERPFVILFVSSLRWWFHCTSSDSWMGSLLCVKRWLGTNSFFFICYGLLNCSIIVDGPTFFVGFSIGTEETDVSETILHGEVDLRCLNTSNAICSLELLNN